MAFNEISLLALVAGTLCVLLGLRIVLRRRLLSQLLALAAALFLLSLGVLILLGGLDLVGYRKLLDEEPVAKLYFKKTGDHQYRARLVEPDGSAYSYRLRGDQWQLDVRLVKWDRRLAALGLSPLYHLDRLSGRYRSVMREMQDERTVYSLYHRQFSIDSWELLGKIPMLKSLVDTRYGSAAFLPMVDGGEYRVAINGTGLVARPTNEIATRASEQW